MSRYKITQTLLNSWLWSYKTEDGYEDFLKTLNREKSPPTQAMLDGIRFEGCVNSVLDGASIPPDHEWYGPVTYLGEYLKGSQKQVNLWRDINVDGIPFVVNGVLDYLRAGVIYDTKYSDGYKKKTAPIKYMDSAQTPLYFYLVPEAYQFQYLICDGEYVYDETYTPDQCTPAEVLIRQFSKFLDTNNLVDIYTDKWKIN